MEKDNLEYLKFIAIDNLLSIRDIFIAYSIMTSLFWVLVYV